MKKAVFSIFCVVLCVAVFSCASGGGGGGGSKSSAGSELAGQIIPGKWTWEPQTPADKDNGDTSICRLEETYDVINGETVRVNKLTGTITNANQYGLGECFIVPDEETLELLKTCKAVSFKVKGDGKRYQIEAPISTVRDWGFHTYFFDTSDEATEYVIQMKMFMQPSWAEATKFNQTRITKFIFKTRNAAEGGVGDFSATIWDFKLHM